MTATGSSQFRTVTTTTTTPTSNAVQAQPPQLNAIIAPSSQAPEAHEAFAKIAETGIASFANDQKPSQTTLENLNDILDQNNQFEKFFLNQLTLGSEAVEKVAETTTPSSASIQLPSQPKLLNEAVEKVPKIALSSSSSDPLPTQLTLESLNDILNQGSRFQKFSLHPYKRPEQLCVNFLKFPFESQCPLDKKRFLDIYNNHSGDELKIFLALIESLTNQRKLRSEDVNFPPTTNSWYLDCAICLLEDNELKQVSSELLPYYQNLRTKEQESSKKISDELFIEINKSQTTFSWDNQVRLSAELPWRSLPEMGNAVKEKCSYVFAATDKFTFIRVQWERRGKGIPGNNGGTKYFLLGRELYDKLAEKAPKKPEQH